ncbi:hypothetical protein GM415_09305 [Pseudodesulfovibrio cashew]|uniref:histidine kinase n=1 Tax=Pseudodesulfovibrio cashew TaxID=2678688 RepID=A0A6I6JIU3_9BACT|nr:HAMP domain-containing sensor histidine kinase [Pseudodesulfovibrio cashew]QGY40313.1 hypothetical protein GM415_09305 [Pseudodesulfovibrio cashew]
MNKHIPSVSLRNQLMLGLGVTIILCLAIAFLFVTVTKSQVKKILDDDLDKMASYVAGLVESDYEAKKGQAHQLAQENALRVVLDLNLPAQARTLLDKQQEDSPFDCLWLLDNNGRNVASSKAGESILLPPVDASRPASFLPWDQTLSVIFVNPIRQHEETVGYLVALSAFPGARVFKRINQEYDVGMAIWHSGRPTSISSWLRRTDYARLGAPAGRHELALTLQNGGKQKFMTTKFPLVQDSEGLALEGELVRSMQQAEHPFQLVNVTFFASLVMILICMAAFSRFLSVQVVQPIRELARNADSIRIKGYAENNPKFDTKTAKRNEVAALYRSFFDMVKSQNEARAKAERAEKVKTDFLSVVSHELRTPMTSVLGFTKMNRKRLADHIYPRIGEGEDAPLKVVRQIENNFDIIISEGTRLTDLINDVLDLAKLESGAFEWNMRPVDVEELLRQSLAACTSLFIDKDLDYRLVVKKGLPLIKGDYDKLMQVVINFLSNAIKFTEAGGEVVCTTYRDGGEAIVSIRDTGIGIPEEEQALVFERFHQRRETLTDKPQGTGLGLPICKNIIEAHGGRIWLESEPGKGSTFSFAIPLPE